MRFPITALVLTVALLVGGLTAYVKYGNGVEFFPSVEPDYGLLYVHARGNLSLDEMDAATSAAEDSACSAGRASSRSTRVSARARGGQDIPEDVVGVIQYEFVDWRERKSAHTRFSTICAASWPGFPASTSKCAYPTPARRPARRSRFSFRRPIRQGSNEYAAQVVAAAVAKVPGVIDMSDGLPPPGVDWALEVDRSKAAQYGVSPDLRSAPSCSSSPPA